MRRPASGALLLGPLALIVWALAIWAFAFMSANVSATTELHFRDAHLELAVPWNGQWYLVEIQMFVADTGDGNFEADVDAARDNMVARFPGAVDLSYGDVSAQYVLNGYWWPSGGTSWAYNNAGAPAGLSGDDGAMSNGAGVWATVGANFAFTNAGTSSAGTGACGGGLDGANTVGWAPQGGSVLAVTCTWFDSGPTPGTAVEFDMQFDPDWNWTTGGSPNVDVESVAAHEFGHALGLGHSSDSSAVMYFAYSTGTLNRVPQPDDIAAIIALYGGPGGSPTETPTPTSTPTPDPGATATPTPPPGASPTPTPTSVPGDPPPGTPTAGGPSPTPTATATATPTRTPTPAVSPTPTSTPVPLPPSLPILPGANLLAWPGQDSSPEKVLAGHGDVIKIVYSYNAATKQWERYGPGLPSYVNSLTLLVPGKAYWWVSSDFAQVAYTP